MRRYLWLLSGGMLLPRVALGQAEFTDALEGAQSLFETLGIQEPLAATFLRVLLIVLVAALLGSALSRFLNKGIAATIAIVFSLISVVLIPAPVLIGIAASYAFLLSLLMALAPVGALLFLVYGIIPGHSLLWRIGRIIVLLIALVLEGIILGWLQSGTTTPEIQIVQEHAASIMSIVMGVTILILITEIARGIGLVKKEKKEERVEERMERDRVPEEVAEEEVSDEEKAEREEKKEETLALDEFILLRKMYEEVEKAPATLSFWQNTKEKLRSLRRAERIEAKLSKRIGKIIAEGERVAREEPRKKTQIDEALLEMKKANDGLIRLMGKKGLFEIASERKLGATFTPDVKKAWLLKILNAAVKYDEAFIAAGRRLKAVIES